MTDTSKPADGYGELVKAGDRAAAALDEARAKWKAFGEADIFPHLLDVADRVLALAAKWEQSAAEMRADARAADMDNDAVTTELTAAMHLEARAAALREAISAGLGDGGGGGTGG